MQGFLKKHFFKNVVMTTCWMHELRYTNFVLFKEYLS